MENDGIYLGDYQLTIEARTHDVVGLCYVETHTKNKVRHRVDEPAVVYKHLHNLEPFRVEWYYKGGLATRPDGEPTIIDSSGEDVLRIWAEKSRIGRTGKPAKTWTAPNGVVVREEYMYWGEFTDSGINVIERDRETGKIVNIVYAGQKIPEYDPSPV